jgi:hypothetical protein
MGKQYNLRDIDKKIIRNLYQNKEGLRAITLKKLIDLKTRNTYKRLNFLRDRELVENIYPIWKLSNGGIGKYSILLKESKIFELHNLAYVVPLIRTPDWWKRKSRKLIKLKGWHFKDISWGRGSSNPYQQLINENYVIQTYPQSIIIICRKRYYADNPYDTIIQALNEFLDLWAWFEERMRFKFFIDGIPQIKLRSNDFNRLKDTLAEHCKKERRGFLVEIPSRGWVKVDFSEPFGKEANYPEAQEILEKDIKDKLMNNPLLPSELTAITSQNSQDLRSLIGVVSKQAEIQNIQSQNIIKHQKVLDGILKEQKEDTKIRKEMSETLKKIQRNLNQNTSSKT